MEKWVLTLVPRKPPLLPVAECVLRHILIYFLPLHETAVYARLSSLIPYHLASSFLTEPEEESKRGRLREGGSPNRLIHSPEISDRVKQAPPKLMRTSAPLTSCRIAFPVYPWPFLPPRPRREQFPQRLLARIRRCHHLVSEMRSRPRAEESKKAVTLSPMSLSSAS